LPSIPVAISERSVTVVGVDAVTKKTRAVASMATRIGVPNMRVWAGRAETYEGNADFSISRATAPMKTLWEWHDRIALDRFSPVTENTWQPGLICLKGGDLDEELEALLETDRTVSINVYDLAHLLNHAYFESKFLIHVYR
jgi:16S rRNA (guanine527-N7)-methyltransferase